MPGLPLHAGDRVDTRTGMARLDLAGGATLHANHNTRVNILIGRTAAGEVPLIDLHRGEVYVADDGGEKVHVATSDGLFSPVGTRFVVLKSLFASIVTVEQGTVQARGRDKQAKRIEQPGDPRTQDLRLWKWIGEAVQIKSGFQTQVRMGSQPATPQAVRVGQRTRWMTRSFREVKVLADFEQASEIEQFVELTSQSGIGVLSSRHVTHGRTSLRLAIGRVSFRCLKGANWRGFTTDWSGYSHFCLDVFSAFKKPVRVRLELRDTIGIAAVEQRYDRRFALSPGHNALRFEIANLRTNDGTRLIDFSSMDSFLLCLESKVDGVFYVDHVRLERAK